MDWTHECPALAQGLLRSESRLAMWRRGAMVT